jgi:DNA-binding beta-propeller fold protein YncE
LIRDRTVGGARRRGAALLALAALVLVLGGGRAAAAAVKPAYVGTVGLGQGSGHAEIYPGGVTVDAGGNVYVADTGNDQIKSYFANGAVRWTVGTRGPKSLHTFDNPRDIAYLDGKLYVADLGNKRVVVLDAATGTALNAWSVVLPSPIGISAGVDQLGNSIILVSQDTKNQVSIYSTSGTFVRNIGSSTAGSGNGELKAPRDAATDSSGNIYVVDYGNDRISKFTATGTWIKNWGGSGGLDGEFRRPYGVDLDVNNTVYVADSTNHRIQVFDSNGNFLAKFGVAPPANTQPGPGEFTMLRRVAVAPGVSNPTIYGADLWGYKVDRITQTAGFNFTYNHTFGGIAPTDGMFNEPSGVYVDANHIYVADAVNQRMQRFSSTSPYAFQLKWGERGWGGDLLGFNWPRDLTLSTTTNTIWVADTKNGRLVEFDPDGVATGRTFGSIGSADGQFNRPYAVEAYGTSVIVADAANNRVQRWNMAGTPSLVWSVTGIGNPQDVTVDGASVIATDTRNNRLIRLDIATGAQIGGFLGVGWLHSPEGVAVDGSGNIWVGDRAYNRVVELSSTGAFIQAFGKLGSAHGQFNHPTHVAVFGSKLYVCDVWNDRVEVFDITGGTVGSIAETKTGTVDSAGTATIKYTFVVGDTNAPIAASLDWVNAGANLNLFLYKPGSSTAVAQAASSSNKPETLSYTPTVTGTYTLKVKAASGSSAFTLNFTHD